MRLVAVVIAFLAAAHLAFGGENTVDYARPESWLALPGVTSAASQTPKDSGFSNLQEYARADVFYIHPTTGMREDVTNVPIDDPDAARMGHIMLLGQATPFNGSARIFAPRYRQMALYLYDKGEEAMQEPLNRAYADVRRAFEHYAANHNNGRPFFIAAHSQGSGHALRLLSEAVQGTPLEARLVAAYTPGIPAPLSLFTKDLTRVPPCARPGQTGCVAIWGTFGEGYTEFAGWEKGNVFWDAAQRQWRAAKNEPLLNVNPVSWKMDGVLVPAARHRGAVPFGVAGTNFTRPIPRLVSARGQRGYTLVSPSPLPPDKFNDGRVFGGANYHVFDINLFWVDIRENVRERLNTFLAARDKAAYPLIGGPSSMTAVAGKPVRFRLAAENGPAVFRAEGLPEGLSLDPAAGEITGAVSSPGVSAVIITAANAAGSYAAELVIMVAPGHD